MSAEAQCLTPRWGALVWNQTRMLLLLQRRDLVLLGALVGAFLALALHGLTSPDHTVMSGGSPGANPVVFPALLPLAMPLSLVGLLWPLGVWRHDPPAGRGYFWSLPVGRGPHTLIRVGVGWSILMAVCLIVVALVAVIAQAYVVRFGDVQVTLAYGYVPLLSTTLTYTLISVLAVTVANPLRTVVWGALALLGLRIVLDIAGVPWISDALGWLVRSLILAIWVRAPRAIDGSGPMSAVLSPDLSQWVLHYAAWLVAGLAALAVVAFIHREA